MPSNPRLMASQGEMALSKSLLRGDLAMRKSPAILRVFVPTTYTQSQQTATALDADHQLLAMQLRQNAPPLCNRCLPPLAGLDEVKARL